jgi:hypothetical protein
MLPFGLTHIVRRAAVVAGAVAIVSAVACSDDTTAPVPAAASIPTTGAQGMILPARSLVTVRVKNVWGQLITDKAALKFLAAGDSVVIWDNSSADKDMTVGVVTVSLPWSATFKACLYTDTQNYAIDAFSSYCNTVAGNATTVNAGSLLMHQFPILGFTLRDQYQNQLVGATVSVIAPPSDGFSRTVADGGAGDLSVGVNGNITIKGNRPGTYSWCETVAPAGYNLASPTCGTVYVGWDMGVGTQLTHQTKFVIVLF